MSIFTTRDSHVPLLPCHGTLYLFKKKKILLFPSYPAASFPATSTAAVIRARYSSPLHLTCISIPSAHRTGFYVSEYSSGHKICILHFSFPLPPPPIATTTSPPLLAITLTDSFMACIFSLLELSVYFQTKKTLL